MSSQNDPTVMFYLPEMKMGGAEISLLRLGEGLRARGVRSVFAVHRVDAAARRLADGAELASLDASRTLVALRRLVVLLRERRPDILVSALTHANIAAVVAARLAGRGTPVVVTEHAPVSSMRALDGSRTYGATLRAMPWAYQLADAVVAVSQGVHDDIAPRLFRRTRQGFGIIPNPVLRPDWREWARAPVDDAWFEAGAPPVVLSVGRLSAEKNHALLIRAFARVAQVSPARLAIIGDGPERDRLQALVTELGLDARVRLLGLRSNPFAFMQRADVFALASSFEGFGNVLVEAMACGLPVVSTDCPVGPREILRDGRYGVLVRPGDVDGMANALVGALRDPRPVDGAQARALEFTVDHSVEAYLALFARLAPGFHGR